MTTPLLNFLKETVADDEIAAVLATGTGEICENWRPMVRLFEYIDSGEAGPDLRARVNDIVERRDLTIQQRYTQLLPILRPLHPNGTLQ